MGGFRDLKVHQKAIQLAMDIYHRTKSFPPEEMYGLTAQIRRSARSICSNIGEGYLKRQYEMHFVARISDADVENIETQFWLDLALKMKKTKG